MTRDEAKQTAETILRQIGGRQFMAMTGARNMAFDHDGSLSFRFPGHGTGPNYCKITLNGLDLYDMTFARIRGGHVKDVDQHGGLYFDQIRGVFERVTGLRTSLTAVYA